MAWPRSCFCLLRIHYLYQNERRQNWSLSDLRVDVDYGYYAVAALDADVTADYEVANGCCCDYFQNVPWILVRLELVARVGLSGIILLTWFVVFAMHPEDK